LLPPPHSAAHRTCRWLLLLQRGVCLLAGLLLLLLLLLLECAAAAGRSRLLPAVCRSNGLTPGSSNDANVAPCGCRGLLLLLLLPLQHVCGPNATAIILLRVPLLLLCVAPRLGETPAAVLLPNCCCRCCWGR
jgi:hypothetical protein